MILDTNAYGILECAIAMICDDNFTQCKQFKVNYRLAQFGGNDYYLTHNTITSSAKYRPVLLLDTHFI